MSGGCLVSDSFLLVGQGCKAMKPIVNGFVRSLIDNAVLYFVCKFGYELKGAARLYCDGERWDKSPPTCSGKL